MSARPLAGSASSGRSRPRRSRSDQSSREFGRGLGAAEPPVKGHRRHPDASGARLRGDRRPRSPRPAGRTTRRATGAGVPILADRRADAARRAGRVAELVDDRGQCRVEHLPGRGRGPRGGRAPDGEARRRRGRPAGRGPAAGAGRPRSRAGARPGRGAAATSAGRQSRSSSRRSCSGRGSASLVIPAVAAAAPAARAAVLGAAAPGDARIRRQDRPAPASSPLRSMVHQQEHPASRRSPPASANPPNSTSGRAPTPPRPRESLQDTRAPAARPAPRTPAPAPPASARTPARQASERHRQRDEHRHFQADRPRIRVLQPRKGRPRACRDAANAPGGPSPPTPSTWTTPGTGGRSMSNSTRSADSRRSARPPCTTPGRTPRSAAPIA